MAVNSSGIIISQLDKASNLNDTNIMPVVQENMATGEAVKETRKTTLGAVKNFFLSAVPAWAKAAQKPSYTAAEVGAATPLEVANAAVNALNSAKAYTNTRLTDYLTEEETNLLLQERIRSLLVDKGTVIDRSELPEEADNFDSYMIEGEELIVFAYNGSSGIVWLPLGFFVDMSLYETVSGATEKMEAAIVEANAYTDTKAAHEAQTRAEADQELQEQINLLNPQGMGNLQEHLNAKQDKITATGTGNLLTAPGEAGGQPGAVPAASFSPADITLMDEEESDVLLDVDSAPIAMKLQGIRNNLKYLFEKKGDNHIVGEGKIFFCEMSDWELAKNRLLRTEYQLIEIANYPELCAKMYCGDNKNSTAPWWYKTNSNNTARSINGTHMRVCSPEGLFPRFAGRNKVYSPTNDVINTPYDGKGIGSFNEQTLIEHTHNTYTHGGVQNNISGGPPAGYNAVTSSTPDRNRGNYGVIKTANGPIVNVGTETAPAWIAVSACISYLSFRQQ
jgi:hypothetical protein